MALINSFTGGWCGISRPLTGVTGNDHGGPEPFSQNAP